MSGYSQPFSNPKVIADTGERIYQERYRKQLEQQFVGKYVAINVRTETATVGQTPEEALELALDKEKGGLFHLIRIGFPGVYSAGYVPSNGLQDRIFRR
jgi:hypothetical protein